MNMIEEYVEWLEKQVKDLEDKLQTAGRKIDHLEILTELERGTLVCVKFDYESGRITEGEYEELTRVFAEGIRRLKVKLAN